jgi:hypothetical protein
VKGVWQRDNRRIEEIQAIIDIGGSSLDLKSLSKSLAPLRIGVNQKADPDVGQLTD